MKISRKTQAVKKHLFASTKQRLQAKLFEFSYAKKLHMLQAQYMQRGFDWLQHGRPRLIPKWVPRAQPIRAYSESESRIIRGDSIGRSAALQFCGISDEQLKKYGLKTVDSLSDAAFLKRIGRKSWTKPARGYQAVVDGTFKPNSVFREYQAKFVENILHFNLGSYNSHPAR